MVSKLVRLTHLIQTMLAEFGIGTDNVSDAIGDTYEAAVRYEGMYNNVGVIVGGGYSFGENEETIAQPVDDRQAWNVGADFDIGPFGLGAAYLEDNGASDGADADDEETIVVGADYTTGPFKLGASYLIKRTHLRLMVLTQTVIPVVLHTHMAQA